MNRNFSQMITVRCDDPAPIIELLEQWDLDQASTDIMGYMGIRAARRPREPRAVPDHRRLRCGRSRRAAADEADRNNERPETQAWAVATARARRR